jgi:hypothetical protein
MEFRQALYELGVRDDTLNTAEKQQLDRDGYLPLEGIFTRAQAERMFAAHKKLWAIEKTGQEGSEATANPERIPRANLTSFWSRRFVPPDDAESQKGS